MKNKHFLRWDLEAEKRLVNLPAASNLTPDTLLYFKLLKIIFLRYLDLVLSSCKKLSLLKILKLKNFLDLSANLTFLILAFLIKTLRYLKTFLFFLILILKVE